METYELVVTGIGALVFGVMIGWITYRTLRNSTASGPGDIATVLGAVGGAAVTTLFPAESIAFGAYCIGLAIGFFAYLLTAINLAKEHGSEEERRIAWLGPTPGGAVPGASPDAGRVDRPGVSTGEVSND